MSAEARGHAEPQDVAEIVDQLFVLMSTVGSHGVDHPLCRRSAQATLEALRAVGPPFALQFVASGLFRDRVLVPLDIEHYLKVARLSQALENLGVHELSVDRGVRAESVLVLGEALARGRLGNHDRLETLRLEGLRWREIPAAQRGAHAENVEPEVFALTQVARAIADAEQIAGAPETPWPWSAGVAIVRRLERAHDADRATVAQALELAPGEWSVARRAVSACAQIQTMMLDADTTVATARGAAHGALALALVGLEARGGADPVAAATALLPRLLEAPVHARSGVEPHRLRVCSAIHQLAAGGDDLEILAPIRLVYELERLRCQKGKGFVLTRIDLLAHAAAGMVDGVGAAWVRLLIHSAGTLPPGSWVRLADGRVGTVLGPGESGEPARPDVLIGGAVVRPDADVRLVAPPDVARRAS